MLRHLTLTLVLATVAFISAPTHSADSKPKTYSAAQIKADLTALYQNLQQGSYDLYVHESKHDYDRAFTKLLQQVNQPMTQLEAHRLFMQFAALAKIAHTRVDFPTNAYKEFMLSGGKTLPIDFAITPDKVSVSTYYDDAATSPIQVGDELVAVDGQPLNEWLAPLQAYIAADNAEIMASLTEGLLVPLLWLHEGERESYQLTLRNAESNTTYTYEQRTLAQDDQVATLDSEVQSSDEKIRDYAILPGSIGYLKPGPFYNVYATSHAEIWDTEEFHNFIDEAFNAFNEQDVAKILIDIRDNPGGTNSFSDHMLAWFADRPFKFASDFRIKVSELSRASNQRRLEGTDGTNEAAAQLAELYGTHKSGDIVSFPLEDSMPHGADKSVDDADVYILIDRYSYSNAVSVAAIAQDYDFATVIGEKTGDLATTYAAMETFTLEQTGIEVGYPKAHIIRPNGDLKADGVTPDVALSFFADDLSEEAELERVIAWLRNI